MSLVSLTKQDLVHGLYNGLSVLSHYGMGLGTARFVDFYVKKLIENEQINRYIAPLCAFGMGTMVSVVLAPKTPLVSFKGRKVIEIAVFQGIVHALISFVMKKKIYIPFGVGEGAMVGWLGSRGLMGYGILGVIHGLFGPLSKTSQSSANSKKSNRTSAES